jgi:fatty-acyl-CoA synthase
MLGQMQQTPLLLTDILRHALRNSADQEIVTCLVEGGINRYTYREAGARIAQLAHALGEMGIGQGDRVGVIGWNTHRQLELYYALAGIGAVCHTINPRLGPENAGFVMNHAGNKAVFYDATFAPLAAGLSPHLPKVETYVEMCPEGAQTQNGLDAKSYEEIIAGKPSEYEWPELDENTACAMCYTSGTTGKPKGVLYSHRALVLHSLVAGLPSSLGCGPGDVCLPVVPMFHVNAWGVPYTALLLGMKLVMPGPGLDGKSLHELIVQENVTYALGVPTVWLGLLGYAKKAGSKLESLERTVVGGSACPPSMISRFREEYGVDTIHAWGMSEMSPLGSVNQPLAKHRDLPEDEQHRIRENQGRPPYGVQLKIVGDDGETLPRDGTSQGDLLVRGHWVLDAYFRMDEHDTLEHGWFNTGDVATLDADGFMTIKDRSKDIIKSGGEWISSVELENIALGNPVLADAAVVGVAHPKWDERPILVAVPAEGQSPSEEELLAYFEGKIAKWQIPDKVVFTDVLPRNATGKVLKRNLRDTYDDVLMG